MATVKTALTSAAFLLASSVALAGDLQNGEKCSETFPVDTNVTHARCESGRCMPGPGLRNQKDQGWYCVSSTYNCAVPVPGAAGAMDGSNSTQMCVGMQRYTCANLPSSPMPIRHFVPVDDGSTCTAAELRSKDIWQVRKFP